MNIQTILTEPQQFRTYFSRSFGLMATREPRSQIAPKRPAMELRGGTVTLRGSGTDPQQPGDDLTWRIGTGRTGTRRCSSLGSAVKQTKNQRFRQVTEWRTNGSVGFTHPEHFGSRDLRYRLLTERHVVLLKELLNPLLRDLHADHRVTLICQPETTKADARSRDPETEGDGTLRLSYHFMSMAFPQRGKKKRTPVRPFSTLSRFFSNIL